MAIIWYFDPRCPTEFENNMRYLERLGYSHVYCPGVYHCAMGVGLRNQMYLIVLCGTKLR